MTKAIRRRYGAPLLFRLPVTLVLVALVLALTVPAGASAQALQESLEVVSETNRGAERSQARIDELSRETRALLEEYQALQQGAEYEAAYSRELEQLAQAQEAKIASLNRQIAQARITRQRILPLMRTMAEALERFVILDLPFHHEERIASVLALRQRLDDPALSVAVRFRLLLEAFQVEQDYGATLEAWQAPLSLEGEQVSVEYLRIGRVALYHQTLDRQRSAIWDAASGTWLTLDAGHNRSLTQAMRVARNQAAPQLLALPVQGSGQAP
jgi:hypothetical protein